MMPDNSTFSQPAPVLKNRRVLVFTIGAGESRQLSSVLQISGLANVPDFIDLTTVEPHQLQVGDELEYFQDGLPPSTRCVVASVTDAYNCRISTPDNWKADMETSYYVARFKYTNAMFLGNLANGSANPDTVQIGLSSTLQPFALQPNTAIQPFNIVDSRPAGIVGDLAEWWATGKAGCSVVVILE